MNEASKSPLRSKTIIASVGSILISLGQIIALLADGFQAGDIEAGIAPAAVLVTAAGAIYGRLVAKQPVG